MTAIEVVLALLVLATVLAGIARRARLPEPIVLVVAGIAVGLVPGIPQIELEPELVFLLFLPPILYSAGYFTSIHDFRANLRPILLLSVGLVIFTTVVVAAALKALVPDLPWAAAFAFGAIVSPPDAVAATAVLRRLGVPRAGRHDPRGGEPRQRRDRARRAADRARRPRRDVQRGQRRHGLPRRRGRRDPRRPRRRAGRGLRHDPHRRRGPRDRVLAAHPGRSRTCRRRRSTSAGCWRSSWPASTPGASRRGR